MFDDFVRVYFSCRPPADENGQYVSYSAYVDLDRADLFKVRYVGEQQILSLGGLGEFDEFGTYPVSVIRNGDEVRAYYAGWTRCESVPFNVAIGMATSLDGGNTFTKLGNGPVLSYSPDEPFVLSGPKIRRFNDVWYLWYIAGRKWKMVEGRAEPVYKVRMASSSDGVHWNKGNKDLIESRIEEDEAQASPDVFLEYAKASGMRLISLGVASNNVPAIRVYEKSGFVADEADTPSVTMNLYLASGEDMNSKRDYNVEIKDTNEHKYAYGFDFDVMHPYMIKSFEPFFNQGSLLELGSFKGDFTRRFLPYFDDVTCVEASDVAIEEARKKLGDQAKFVNSLFENAALPKRYDNIVLTHVLEHLDDPVSVLKRINDEWLTENGRFFLVCPNANVPSRQIAVKMGLISHNAAVTPAEAEHGHRCTYTLDTLERDAVAAGLKVVHRSGIFFKALANFQWDRLLQTDIISTEYLDGCYKLGQQYPDLCSSIFLMCERGDL